jgi:hypothetical protein
MTIPAVSKEKANDYLTIEAVFQKLRTGKSQLLAVPQKIL